MCFKSTNDTIVGGAEQFRERVMEKKFKEEVGKDYVGP